MRTVGCAPTNGSCGLYATPRLDFGESVIGPLEIGCGIGSSTVWCFAEASRPNSLRPITDCATRSKSAHSAALIVARSSSSTPCRKSSEMPTASLGGIYTLPFQKPHDECVAAVST